MTFKELKQRIEMKQPTIIALDGPSGGGKSSFATYLEHAYDVLVFRMDDYFLPSERKTRDRMIEPGGNLDYERFEREVTMHLKDDIIPSNHFNCKTNKLEMREPRRKKPIILIEGVYSMHPRFRFVYDVKIFLDISRMDQLDRIMKRSGFDMLQRFENEWIPLEERYFNVFRIRKAADIYLESSLKLHETFPSYMV